MLLSHNPETAETSRTAGKPELAGASAEAGQRLSEAQSADYAWRTSLVLGLYRRLQWLRRFDRVVQYTGAGVGVALLLTTFFLAFDNAVIANDDVYTRLLFSLIAGAVAASAGGVGAVAVTAWCSGRIWNWIVRAGMEEHLARLEESLGTAPQHWTCPRCRSGNRPGTSACESCARMKPAGLGSSTSRTEIRIGTDLILLGVLIFFLVAPVLWVLLTVFGPRS